MVNAARLAPLEEILAELEGESSGGSSARPASTASQSPARSSVTSAFAATASSGVPQAPAIARMPAAVAPRVETAIPPMTQPAVRSDANIVAERPNGGPVPGSPPSKMARAAEAGAGFEAEQVDAIKAAILGQEKFLGELVAHASRWEMSGGEVRLFFQTESRALAEMLQARDPMERLRNIASRILGQAVRVCVKLEAVQGSGAAARPSPGTRELRAKFEQDPIVRAMLERFGGQISDVKSRSEE